MHTVILTILKRERFSLIVCFKNSQDDVRSETIAKSREE